MVVSLDLPDILVEKIDALVARRPVAPEWPFEKRNVEESKLTISERALLEAYQAALAAYKHEAAAVQTQPHSRSSVVTTILEEVFGNDGKH